MAETAISFNVFYELVNIVYVIASAVYGVRYMHELFVSKTRTSDRVRASEGFWHKQRVNITPYKAISMW